MQFFFFFKQKTAYEMRISDWSSDVCSSDLREAARRTLAADLDADIADHVMHHEQWMRAQGTLQPLAEQRVKLETASYGAGRASLIDVADAFAALAAATLTTVDREAKVAADGAGLNFTDRKRVGKGKGGSVRVDLGGRHII